MAWASYSYVADLGSSLAAARGAVLGPSGRQMSGDAQSCEGGGGKQGRSKDNASLQSMEYIGLRKDTDFATRENV